MIFQVALYLLYGTLAACALVWLVETLIIDPLADVFPPFRRFVNRVGPILSREVGDRAIRWSRAAAPWLAIVLTVGFLLNGYTPNDPWSG